MMSGFPADGKEAERGGASKKIRVAADLAATRGLADWRSVRGNRLAVRAWRWYAWRVAPTRQGSFRLFRFAGIWVYLHWSWFLVAAVEVSTRSRNYSSFAWNVLEYLSLFAMVLLHEFGHALACRQVGGQADQIVLWPLGGVAYVSPPQRPGPTLWSIAAGPLVNVVLFPILSAVLVGLRLMDWVEPTSDLHSFLTAVWAINLGLLIFNLLPIYPLDGGQILRSLLWFVVGRARSLMVAATVGFIGVVALLVVAFFTHEVWLIIVAVFMLLNCWSGLLQARLLARAAAVPRRAQFLCPGCRAAPPQGDFWMCSQCRKAFDTFGSGGVCPQCGAGFGVTRCLECGGHYPMQAWIVATPPE